MLLIDYGFGLTVYLIVCSTKSYHMRMRWKLVSSTWFSDLISKLQCDVYWN